MLRRTPAISARRFRASDDAAGCLQPPHPIAPDCNTLRAWDQPRVSPPSVTQWVSPAFWFILPADWDRIVGVRILVLTDTYPPENRGGAGEVASLVADGLASQGHEICVVTSGRGADRDPHPRPIASDGNTLRLARPIAPDGNTLRSRDAGVPGNRVTVRRIRTPVPAIARRHLSILNPVALAGVWRVAREFRPDAVHVHNVHERLSFASLAVARGGGTRTVPVVLTAHDYLLFCLTKFLCSRGDVGFAATPTQCEHCTTMRRVPGRNLMVHGLVKRYVTSLACISHAQARAMARNGFADVPTTVVHNGLDASMCETKPSDGEAFRRRLGLDSRPIVLFGGRASGAKGGDQLARAMVRAIKRVPSQLVVLGDRPEYFVTLRAIADGAGLQADALHDGGWLDPDGLREAHGAASVCAIPSVYPDPFNLMTLRAMLHGRPVVGTCHGATPELVVDGETGLIADPWDADAFGDALADILLDPDRARLMGEAGRKRGMSMFTLGRQIEAYARLLGRELHDPPQPIAPYGNTLRLAHLNPDGEAD